MYTEASDRAFIVACGCTYLGPEYDARKWLGPSPYCAGPVVEGYSYCAEHVEQMYQKGTALRKRKKDIKRAEAVWDIASMFNDVVAELESEGEIEL
jgi:hypothetical protein